MFGDFANFDKLDSVGWLLKEEGWFARGVRSHFARMGGIVAANTIDAADAEEIGGSDDRNGCAGRFKQNLGSALCARIIANHGHTRSSENRALQDIASLIVHGALL